METDSQKSYKNLLTLLEEDGFVLEQKSGTRGGEYKGPCPWCGGTDRFTVWPNDPGPQDAGGQYICRQCDDRRYKSGNGITYLMFSQRKYAYKAACKAFGIKPQLKKERMGRLPITATGDGKPVKKSAVENWKPRENKSVDDMWSNKAEVFLFNSFKYLLSAAGKKQREYLKSRGLPIETIRTARIGYNPTAATFDPTSWGISLDHTESVSKKTPPKTKPPKNVWIPKGLLIPLYSPTGKVVRLRIRQDEPLAEDRYIMVAGSASGFLHCAPAGQPFSPDKPSIIVESELDGWMLSAIESHRLNVFASGSAQARPDAETHILLRQTPIILSLDSDVAGAKEVGWWSKAFPGRVVLLSPDGAKDPGEMFQEGFATSISEWIDRGITETIQQGIEYRPQVSRAPAEIPAEIIEVAIVPEAPVIPQEKIVPTEEKGTQAEPKKPMPIESTHEKRLPVSSVRACRHGKFCSYFSYKLESDEAAIGQRLPISVCLATKSPDSPTGNPMVARLSTCPMGFWRLYEDSKNLSSIVLMPDYYQNQKTQR